MNLPSLYPPSVITHESSHFPDLASQLRSLRAALTVVRQGSTIRAAQAMHLSQPAVARSVLQLEEACRLPLFIRGARGMMPTALGNQMAARIETMLQHLGSGAAEAQAASALTARRSSLPHRFAEVVPPGHLRALLAIAHCGSESQAAQKIGVTQPSIHAALQGLEASLGLQLFYKLTFGTRLTPSGEALLRRVKLALAEIRDMESDISAWHGQIKGRVVVGVLPLSVGIFLPAAVDRLSSSHPDIEISIVDGTYESLMQGLMSADIDVIAGALRAQVPEDEVQQLELFDDDLVVVAPSDHDSLQREHLTLEDLLQWQWVTPLPNTPADSAMVRLFRSHGLEPPRSNLRASSPTMTLAFVLQTGRLALASRGQAMRDNHGGLLSILPVELPSTRRGIGLAIRAQGTASQNLDLFIRACHQTMADLPA
ncbi:MULTISPECIES: LysR family transcriptional regulator [Comamonas]|nr:MULTISPECIES: LysR family transcriptional regulator [Comamonas]TZG09021.1 LysR family transcriptional regulator [Comamonas thiooxydans]UNV92584.1 LysR family transcriptional regulator [Comamonas sp. 7D-2evo1]UNV94116.1 LysR family transcriptional regulator [Comamonas sp. 7D-2]UNW02222.1 LysR family transcriptional regulator [Comamonas sp. 7D-2evo2]BAI50721.1 putative LysR-type transcriptional regulator [Comamonas sp. E6]